MRSRHGCVCENLDGTAYCIVYSQGGTRIIGYGIEQSVYDFVNFVEHRSLLPTSCATPHTSILCCVEIHFPGGQSVAAVGIGKYRSIPSSSVGSVRPNTDSSSFTSCALSKISLVSFVPSALRTCSGALHSSFSFQAALHTFSALTIARLGGASTNGSLRCVRHCSSPTHSTSTSGGTCLRRATRR